MKAVGDYYPGENKAVGELRRIFPWRNRKQPFTNLILELRTLVANLLAQHCCFILLVTREFSGMRDHTAQSSFIEVSSRKIYHL